MKATLPDGTVISGTPDEIKAFTKGERSPRVWYQSASKGWVKLADMNVNHLRNALLRCYRKWLATLSPTAPVYINNEDFIKIVLGGPTDLILLGLLEEISRRKE